MPPDEFTLLCESCGYAVEGLDGNCPECGKPITESLPDARPGSPWQRNPGRIGWRDTALAAMNRPKRMWDQVSVAAEKRPYIGDDELLIVINTIVAGAIVVAAFGAPVAIRFVDRSAEANGVPAGLSAMIGTIAAGIAGALAAAGFLFLLSFIEQWGIRIFGWMHNRRITPAIARTIIAHASYGWVLAGLLVGAGRLVGGALAELARHEAALQWELAYMAPWLLPLLGFFVGMLVFESLTWFGVVNMRYANRARPESAEPAADAARTIDR